MTRASDSERYFIYIIDGTGAPESQAYEAEMRHSFCRQLANLAGGNARYARGPTNLGTEMFVLSDAAVFHLGSIANAQPDTRLFLAGYSRGAAAVIHAANRLQHRDIEVEGLFLFDAVLMQVQLSAHTMAPNIRHAYHIMRPSRSAGRGRLISRYDGAILDKGFVPANPFRPDWGNCGRQVQDPARTKLVSMRLSIGSHGAVGGVGWRGVEQEEEAQQKTAMWMNAYLAQHGLPSGLTSLPIDAQLPDLDFAKKRSTPSRLANDKVRRSKI